MSYCRFQNTLIDLRDCYDYFDDRELSRDEERARDELLRLCMRIVDSYTQDGEIAV